MASCFEADGRPFKRIRLDQGTDSAQVPQSLLRISEHILLVDERFHVNIDEPHAYKVISQHEVPLDITPTFESAKSPTICVRLNVAGPKIDARVTVNHVDSNRFQRLIEETRVIRTHSSKAGGSLVVKVQGTVEIQRHQPILRICILWPGELDEQRLLPPALRQILQRHADVAKCQKEAEAWDVKEFYDNVHVTQRTGQSDIQIDLLQCQLYPFQVRTTHWLLSREIVVSTSNGQLAHASVDTSVLPLDFQPVTDAEGNLYYYSEALGLASRSQQELHRAYSDVSGGILAEAMGLGKTVEMIALICAHMKGRTPLKIDESSAPTVIKATLIVTPPSILEQWKAEIREHAPALKVYHYTGIRTKDRRKDDMLDFLSEQDVVLTTYHVVAHEVHYVRDKPDRQLRGRPRPDPPRSPLTQFKWWRCLLDEAQMVESGVSAAAEVCRLIPRVHAWAVTGTPLKQSHRDLYGLLLFLRHEPWCSSARTWDHLVYYYRPLLRRLVGTIALRHSKEVVREELKIPSQIRQTVVIPFSAIEETHYAQLRYDMQEEIGLDRTGAPLDDSWDPNDPVTTERMRNWLQRLRQTCLHPEVGSRNKRALGRPVANGGALRTVAQVLDVMIEQVESTIHTEQRNWFLARIKQAQLVEHARLSQQAQDLLVQILKDVSEVVASSRTELASTLQALRKGQTNSTPEDDPLVVEDNTDVDECVATARQRLRAVLEVQHICHFFIGNTYFQLKEMRASVNATRTRSYDDTKIDHEAQNVDQGLTESIAPGDTGSPPVVSGPHAQSDDDVDGLERAEAESYQEAKKIRSELLSENNRKAQRLIRSIHGKSEEHSFVNLGELDHSEDDFGGIESRKIFEKLYMYCKAMNAQGRQYVDMRTQMVDMLRRALVDADEDDELTGEEYENSTKLQDEMYVVMEMLRALCADRQDALTGQENMLTKSETKSFLREAKEGNGPAPELMIKLLAERASHKIDHSKQGSLRGILTEIRALVSSLEYQEINNARAAHELVIVKQLLQHTQKLQITQTRTMVLLQQEVELFRDTMNARLDYYRALQRISDTVAPYGEEEDIGRPVVAGKMQTHQAEERLASARLDSARAKQRYLLHLKHESTNENAARICTICQFEFEIGTLTVCGHQFCKECIQLWWAQHRNCPVCKRHLKLSDFHDVTYKPAEPTAEATPRADCPGLSASYDPRTVGSTVSAATLRGIQSINIQSSSYGSKVDTLNRHILYLRQHDPGSKTIIFSQYRDFLDVLSRSLRQNGIIHSKFDDKDGIVEFKSNPASECFLLHAKAHATGLNLVCASHVVLCEPLVNTAIELQAIARVHRIGQQRVTTVWTYLIAGTVEEAIYNIGMRRRLAHIDSRSREISRTGTPSLEQMLRKEEDRLEDADTKVQQATDLSKLFAAGKSGGEQVDKEDLWECLFGNVGQGQSSASVSRSMAALENTIEPGSRLGRVMRANAVDART